MPSSRSLLAAGLATAACSASLALPVIAFGQEDSDLGRVRSSINDRPAQNGSVEIYGRMKLFANAQGVKEKSCIRARSVTVYRKTNSGFGTIKKKVATTTSKGSSWEITSRRSGTYYAVIAATDKCQSFTTADHEYERPLG